MATWLASLILRAGRPPDSPRGVSRLVATAATVAQAPERNPPAGIGVPFRPRRASSEEATTPPPSSSSTSIAHLRSNSRQADGSRHAQHDDRTAPFCRRHPPSEGGGGAAAMRRRQLRGGGVATYRRRPPPPPPDDDERGGYGRGGGEPARIELGARGEERAEGGAAAIAASVVVLWSGWGGRPLNRRPRRHHRRPSRLRHHRRQGDPSTDPPVFCPGRQMLPPRFHLCRRVVFSSRRVFLHPVC